MSLRDAFKQAAEDVFAAFDDVPVAITLNKRDSNTYDPATGSSSGTTSSATAQAVITQYKASDVDDQRILRSDKRAIIRQEELNATPDENDTLTSGFDGRVYKILDVAQDPAQVLWFLQLRAV